MRHSHILQNVGVVSGWVEVGVGKVCPREGVAGSGGW